MSQIRQQEIDSLTMAFFPFLQMMAIIIVPFGVSALALIPKTAGDLSDRLSPRDKLKRLDVVGCFMMLVSIILLILGITLGASYGWKKPGFLVPFLLCWPIFVAFFIYEARLSEGYALIPPSFWKIPNMTLLIVFALGIYPWWCVSQFLLLFLLPRADVCNAGKPTSPCRKIHRLLQ